MTVIPWATHSYCDENPADGRWDQEWVKRILRGDEGRPSRAFDLERSTPDDVIERGGILVHPFGHYHDHGEKHIAMQQLLADLNRMPWGVLIATSDESSSFDWHKAEPWPTHIQLYVMTPRPEHSYPTGTRFIGEGAPRQMTPKPWTERDLDIVLVAQDNHERRTACFDAFEQFTDLKTVIVRTEEFAAGYPHDTYADLMGRAKVAPCPSGQVTQDSFRLFEALESGCIPIADDVRLDGGGDGYWRMLGMPWLAHTSEWDGVADLHGALAAGRSRRSALVSSMWQQHKRRLVADLHDDIHRHELRTIHTPHDQITVIVPTSPIPSHPSIDMIVQTVASVRTDLPGAEILITCDGLPVGSRQKADDYDVYLHDLCVWTLGQFNVTPFIHDQHMHQSGMMRHVLDRVTTDYVLYVEHDCPVVGPVPWADVLAEMDFCRLNSMRLMHESHVLAEHEHLFLEASPDGEFVPWLPTVQWSQRPHLARTDWYREIMSTYFGSKARTMIEDVMHGVVQHNWVYADGIRSEEHWRKWGMAVYAPEGSMKRSGHLDGRAGDPKLAMRIAYDGERPVGAPREGWLE